MAKDFFVESRKWIKTLENASFSGATGPFIGYLKFIESFTNINQILDILLQNQDVKDKIEKSSFQEPPKLATLDEVASACVIFLNLIREKKDVTILCNYGIKGRYDNELLTIPSEFVQRYVDPLQAYLELMTSNVTLLKEMECRYSTLSNPECQEAAPRIAGFLRWLQANQATSEIITQLIAESSASTILENSNFNAAPQPETPDDTAAIGILLMQKCLDDIQIYELSYNYGIFPESGDNQSQSCCDAIMRHFIIPSIRHIENEIVAQEQARQVITTDNATERVPLIPPEIQASLTAFEADHPETTAFIMMQFAQTETHNKIVATIKKALAPIGITALRADDYQYHDDIFPNVKNYMHGCAFGIAVFERIENEVFNPNVSLEVGYMLALGKPICYLKDKSLKNLPTDLISKLYREFDTHAVETTLPTPLLKWLDERKPFTKQRLRPTS
jgi:hypothetical protein